jgi:diguanylate cyclase
MPVGSAASPTYLADTLPQIIWTATPDGCVTYFNKQWYAYTGLSVEESLGLGFVDAIHPRDRARTLKRWERAWRFGEPYEIEYRLYSRGLGEYRWFLGRGRALHDDCGTVIMWTGTCTDIETLKRFEAQVRRHAAELKESRAELARLARHDGLTGLPNRLLFEDRLQHALAAADRHQQCAAVFFIDLDGFKRVNDTLGHVAGDTLLREVAQRLQGSLRGSDTLARMGGDEFVALAGDFDTPEDAVPLARKLLMNVSMPYDLGDQRVRVTASVGVSVYPKDAGSAGSLLRHADIAMYRAKQSGKNDVRFFSPSMNAAVQERLLLARHLDGALERGELDLHYQPQWDAREGRVRSFEALLRWKSPWLGDVPPERFVPVAEENGLILDICTWVLHESCEHAARWSRLAGEPIRVAMNVSLLQLDRDSFVDTVERALQRHDLPPEQLELELSARMGFFDPVETMRHIASLRSLGVQLSMDDFGTESSSIGHVLRFPLDALKISASIAPERSGEGDAGRVFDALVGLARSLDLDVVATGIEREDQRQRALRAGCGRMQGFLLGRPAPSAEAAAIVGEVVADGGTDAA